MRPRSIILFERLYLGSFVLGVVNAIQLWNARLASLRAQGVADSWPLAAMTLLGWVISLALLYLVARKGSSVAKWIIVVLAAWGVFLIANSVLAMSQGGTGRSSLLIGIAQNLLYAVAASMLFKPDARMWFGEPLDDEPVEEDEVHP